MQRSASGWFAPYVARLGWRKLTLIGVLLAAFIAYALFQSVSEAREKDRTEATKRLYHTYQLAKRERARHDGRFTTATFSQRDLILALNQRDTALDIQLGDDRDGNGIADAAGDGELVMQADGERLSMAQAAGGRTIELAANARGFTFH